MFNVFGSIFIILGIMIMEPGFFAAVKDFCIKNAPSRVDTGKKIAVIGVIAVIYIAVDLPVALTNFLPDYIGIKNSLPFIAGLFFGILGVIGCCIGAVTSSLILGESLVNILWECWCITAIGLCMYFGWLYCSMTHRVRFKNMNQYLRYIISAVLGSILCLKPDYMLSYFAAGMLIGLPVNILFGSILYIEPVLPGWCRLTYDAEFELDPSRESLVNANEILHNAAVMNNIASKRIIQTQSCLEELSLRIFRVIPNAKINVNVIYQEAVSMQLNYSGEKYNPFRIHENESGNLINIAGLKIIKYRALRVSFFYHHGENKIHVVDKSNKNSFYAKFN
ncbi:MAG: hypothetical protein IJP48_06815 [Synergistaceae bacterium]|nr:hypothetical protein [Synergistaceae bacterium]